MGHHSDFNASVQALEEVNAQNYVILGLFIENYRWKMQITVRLRVEKCAMGDEIKFNGE